MEYWKSNQVLSHQASSWDTGKVQTRMPWPHSSPGALEEAANEQSLGE